MKIKKIIFSLFIIIGLIFLTTNKVNASSSYTISTYDGASIRLESPAGLKFQGVVTGEVSGNNVKYGIVFANGIKDLSELTVSSPNTVYAEVDSLKDDNTYAVSIVNIPLRAYTSYMTARAYVYVDGTYKYADNVVVRCIYDVAKAYKEIYGSNEFVEEILNSCFEINYNLNGGTLPSNEPISYTILDEVILPTPEKTGYDFLGWYSNSNFSGNKISSISKGQTEDLTLYAKWEKSTITYVLNGGTFTDTEVIDSLLDAYKGISSNVNNYNGNYWSDEIRPTSVFLCKKGTAINPTYGYFIGLKQVGSYFEVCQLYGYNEAGTLADEVEYAIYWTESAEPALTQNYSSIELGNIIKFSEDITTLTGTSVTIDIDFTVYNVLDFNNLISSDATISPTFPYVPTTNVEKDGYVFNGWYLDQALTIEAEELSSTATLYAKWSTLNEKLTAADFLTCVSDTATSYTEDELILETPYANITWSSSNNNIYKITNNIGSVLRSGQTHKKQTVTITVNVEYIDGTTDEAFKDITIDPVVFDEISSTPIATYFNVSAMSTYTTYNTRYKTDGSYFSESTKETLDIVYYAFATLDSNGNVSLSLPKYIDQVIKLKDSGTRIIVSVNGATSDGQIAFYNAANDATIRKTFVTNLMNLVEQYNFDGIDIDWEYNSSYPITASTFTALVTDIRSEMALRNLEGGTPYMLTAAIPANSWTYTTSGGSYTRFDFEFLNNNLDYINLMSYDLNKSDYSSHFSPLYTSSYDRGYGFGVIYGVSKLTTAGFSKSKIIIGAGTYGKAFEVTGTSYSSKYPGLGAAASLTQISGLTGSYATGTLFGNAIQTLIDSGNYTKYTEYNASGQFVASYLYSSTDNIFVTYDSEEALTAKLDYASSIAGMGVFTWAYCEDPYDRVINVFNEYLNN